VGHVGEVTFEAVHLIHAKGNEHAGWPFREGGEGFPKSECQKITPNVGDCVDPVYRCEQSDNKDRPTDACPGDWGAHCDNPDIPNQCDSITGGVILSSCVWPDEFRGKYVFGDNSSRRLWTLPINEARDKVIGEREDLATGTGGPVQFVEHSGALYVVQYSGAKSYVTKIAPILTPIGCNPAAPLLSSAPSETPPAPSAPAVDGGDTLADASDAAPNATTQPAAQPSAEAPATSSGQESNAPKAAAHKASCDCAVGQTTPLPSRFFVGIAFALTGLLFHRRRGAMR
jgi:hypothetical protein